MVKTSTGTRKLTRTILITVSVIVSIPVLAWFAFMWIFDHTCSRASGIVPGITRHQVQAMMKGYGERTLASGEQPVWPFLHVKSSVSPRDIVNREYRLWRIPIRHAAVCVAYDKNDRVIGCYEYD